MARRRLSNASLPDRLLKCPLNPSLVKMVTAPNPGPRAHRVVRSRKYELPYPLRRSIDVLRGQRVGKVDAPPPFRRSCSCNAFTLSRCSRPRKVEAPSRQPASIESDSTTKTSSTEDNLSAVGDGQ